MCTVMNFIVLTSIIITISASNSPVQIASKLDSNSRNYTLVERNAIEKLRSLVSKELYKDYMRRDEYLIRWLRDQNFDLERAQGKLLRSLKWRKENNVDSVLTEDFSDIIRLCHYDLTGQDKSGAPVFTLGIGSCPIRKIVLSGQTERLRRLIYFIFESCAKIIQELQDKRKNVEGGTVIANIDTFSLREHGCLKCIPIVMEIATLFDRYYPQYIHTFHVINMPRTFEGISAILFSLVSERTKEIFHFHGYNKDEWRSAVLKTISPDQIESAFGGTKLVKPYTSTSYASTTKLT